MSALGAALSLALVAQPEAAPAATPLSPAAGAAAAAFRAELDAVRRRHAAAGPSESVAGELARRVELEQAGRKAMHALFDLPTDARQAAMRGAWAELGDIDRDNTAYLKRVIPPDGWFRKSRDGAVTAGNAWLIAQHALHDGPFMRRVLARMEPLARRGEVDGAHYAMLYDRVAARQGRLQRYSTQATCKGGVWAFFPSEDPAGVDQRRRAVGHPDTLARTAERLKIGRPC